MAFVHIRLQLRMAQMEAWVRCPFSLPSANEQPCASNALLLLAECADSHPWMLQQVG